MPTDLNRERSEFIAIIEADVALRNVLYMLDLLPEQIHEDTVEWLLMKQMVQRYQAVTPKA